MEKFLNAIEEKLSIGYTTENLEVDFGCPDYKEDTEGYYLSKLNGWGSTPITEVLAVDGEINDKELITKLDELGIAYCL